MILGAVLAGGQSRRFGSDKAAALWNGRPLIDHAIANLSTFVESVVICGRPADGLPGLADRPQIGMGPLGGLNAALHYAQANGYRRVITMPCDTPSLPGSLLSALIVPEGNSYLADMPVIGSWQSSCAVELDRYLEAATSFSVRGWAERIGATPLHLPSPANINHPEDLDRLDE